MKNLTITPILFSKKESRKYFPGLFSTYFKSFLYSKQGSQAFVNA